MRAIAALALTLSVALTLFVAGFLSASALMAKPATETLARIDMPDLWPATPRRVEAKDLPLERAPAAAPVSLQPSGALPLSQAPVVATGSQEIDQSRPGAALSAEGPTLGDMPEATRADHIAWCEERYRSYDPVDDSYSAYSGERKTCVSPYMDVAASADPAIEPAALPNDHVSACEERYASYRASDNTYQPFSGARRVCTLD